MAKQDKSKDTVVAEALVKGQPAGALAQFEDYGEDRGMGAGHLTAEEKSIPFLELLQSNSPAVEKQLVPGAKAGMFLNTVTKELIPGNVGLVIQPVYADRSIVEWKPRDSGGGLVARHTPTSPEALEAKDAHQGSWIATKDNPVMRNGNNMVDTRYLYCNVLSEDGEEFTGAYFLLAASKSKIKPTQNFVTAIDIIRGKPPLFAARARLTSVVEIQKGSGKEYHNVRFMPYLPGKTYLETLIPGKGADGTKHPLLVAGRAFYDAITGGVLKADFDAEKMEADEATEEKRHF
jgi:hypothetical protein